jgi:hypothetical protein
MYVILKTRISTTNFAMLNGGPIAVVASFGEAVECYGQTRGMSNQNILVHYDMVEVRV